MRKEEVEETMEDQTRPYRETEESLRALSVYRGVLNRPVTAALLRLCRAAAEPVGGDCAAACGALYHELLERGREDSLPAAVAEEVLTDENALTVALAAGREPSERLRQAAASDLRTLYRAAQTGAPPRQSPAGGWGALEAPAPLDRRWDLCLNALADFHRRNGCGEFARHAAFLWRDGRMQAVRHPDPIRLSDLKGYEYQHETANANTLAFLNGLPANNILFYGDRGTGKSSTVKALLNEYAGRGLRMIEVPKAYLHELPDLTDRLAALPMRFILFIDDLSFAGDDDNFAALKAVLEGGLAARPDNVLLYATSNRRHLLRESFDDREGSDLHHADTIQEAVSLSDRFGITLTYLLPDKERFLQIVEQLAADSGLAFPREELRRLAEQWALERGARSPRYARQFITDLQHHA